MELSLENRKILIVDDNQNSRDFIKNSLSHLVKHVDQAENGQEAIKKTQQDNYDLIFMDIKIPDMDGYEISKNIRSGNNQNIPIVTFTSVDKDIAKPKSLEACMNDFVQKPATQNMMVGILEKWLANDNQKKTILLAEDEFTSAKLISFMLKASGYNVITATNGQDAVDILKEEVNQIDLILMDTQMPVLDGMEATKIIRQMKYRDYKNIPIIAISGNTDDVSNKNATDIGINYCLGKPFQKDALIEVIKNHLS